MNRRPPIDLENSNLAFWRFLDDDANVQSHDDHHIVINTMISGLGKLRSTGTIELFHDTVLQF